MTTRMRIRLPVRGGSDRGVATVVVCLCVAALLVVTVLGLRLGGAVLAAQRAGTAADLGALAGAARVLDGAGSACARAAQVVAANGARMTGCEVVGLDLRVQTGVTVRLGPLDGQASGRSRAGPDR